MATARFDPAGPLRGSLRPPARQVDLPPRRDPGRDGRGGDGGPRLPGRRGYELHARGDRRAGRDCENRPRIARSNSAIGELELRIQGVGLRGAAPAPIDVGNAGTLHAPAAGLAGGTTRGTTGPSTATHPSAQRPVDRVVDPLTEMGAAVSAREGRVPPLEIDGSAAPRASPIASPSPAPRSSPASSSPGSSPTGETTVVEPAPTRDHTERMLRAAGAELAVEPAGTPVAIRGRAPRKPDHGEPCRAPPPRRADRARRLLLGGLPPDRRRPHRAAARSRSPTRASTRPGSAFWGSSTGWGPASRSTRASPREASRSAR